MENKGIRVVGHRLRKYKYLVNKQKKSQLTKKKKKNEKTNLYLII